MLYSEAKIYRSPQPGTVPASYKVFFFEHRALLSICTVEKSSHINAHTVTFYLNIVPTAV